MWLIQFQWSKTEIQTSAVTTRSNLSRFTHSTAPTAEEHKSELKFTTDTPYLALAGVQSIYFNVYKIFCVEILKTRFMRNTLPWLMSHLYNDVIKWKNFTRYWPFVRGIHRSPVNSPHKGQWRGALMFSFICVWINGWEVEKTIVRLVIWDAIAPIVTSLQWKLGIGEYSIMMLVKFRTSANQKHWSWSYDESELCTPWLHLLGDEVAVGSSLMFRKMGPWNIIRKYTAGQD